MIQRGVQELLAEIDALRAELETACIGGDACNWMARANRAEAALARSQAEATIHFETAEANQLYGERAEAALSAMTRSRDLHLTMVRDTADRADRAEGALRKAETFMYHNDPRCKEVNHCVCGLREVLAVIAKVAP